MLTISTKVTFPLFSRMSLLFCTIFFLPLFPFLADAFSGGQWAILATHSSDNWAADQRHQPKCLDIPVNFTLCHGMQVSEQTNSLIQPFNRFCLSKYKKMRLPNLLEHERLFGTYFGYAISRVFQIGWSNPARFCLDISAPTPLSSTHKSQILNLNFPLIFLVSIFISYFFALFSLPFACPKWTSPSSHVSHFVGMFSR